MAGAYSVDVIAFHKADIPEHLLTGNHSLAFCAPFVTVDPLEDNTLLVQAHDAVFQSKSAEADLRFSGFDELTIYEDFNGERVERRLFRTPRQDVRNARGGICLVTVKHLFPCGSESTSFTV